MFGWLVGYSGFLGPIAGVLICDYFSDPKKSDCDRGLVSTKRSVRILRRCELEGDWRRWRWVAAWRSVGLVYSPLRVLYDYAWFVGFGVSFIVYSALMAVPAEAEPQAAD